MSNNIKQNYKLVSFDIFDTLITRTTATPTGIFSIMQKNLNTLPEYSDLPCLLKENFYSLRKEAESFVRRNAYVRFNAMDIKFEDIYALLKNNYNLTDEQVERLKTLELETEYKNIIGIPENINLLRDYMDQGKKVILISDMYHSQETIRKFLQKIDSRLFKDIKIYVSCEHNKTKDSKELYLLIHSIEHIEYKDWLHIGDNIHADIYMAKELGINTKFIEVPPFMPYENQLFNSLFLTQENFDIQSVLGISKLSRRLTDIKSKVYEFGCSFAGPILYGYVNWLINDAMRRDIQTLYFIARDGYILKFIADEIVKAKNLNIKTKYIYGSRKAWRVPCEENINELIEWTFREYIDRHTVEFITKRLGLEIKDMEDFFKINISNPHININKYFDIENDIKNNEEFKQFVIDKNKDRAINFKKYLNQEIDFNEKFAFVDFNGSGRTQDTLQNILNCNIKTYYFYSELNIILSEKSEKLLYFSTRFFHNHFMELLCRCNEGQCIKYINKEEKIYPVLEEYNSECMEKWGIDDYRKGIITYVKNTLSFEIQNNLKINIIDIYRFYFSYITNNLDPVTANILGDIPYIEVGSETAVKKCAKELTAKDFFKMLFIGNKVVTKDLSFISIKRSHPIFGKLFNFNQTHGSILRCLFNFNCSKKQKRICIRFLGIKLSFKNLRYKTCNI